MICGLLAVGAGAFFLLQGIGNVHDKQRVLRTATGRCRSVSLGTVGLSGSATGAKPIASLITQIPSYISRVVVEEERQSRNGKRWEKVHEQEFRVPFYLDDGTGAVKVNPEGSTPLLQADVSYSAYEDSSEYADSAFDRALLQSMAVRPLSSLFRDYCELRRLGHGGSMRFQETNLCPGDPVYVFGSAVSGRDFAGNKETEDLVIQKSGGQPFFIVEGGKQELMQQLGSNTGLRISGGAMAIALGSAFLLSLIEPASSVDATVAGLALFAALATFCAVIGITAVLYVAILFNSVVNQKNEVERAFSNIDVLLKQRFDLIPNLVTVCEAYMHHEAELLGLLAQLRSGWTTANNKGSKLNAATDSDNALQQLFATSERYPAVRANENFLQLQHTLTELELQIADRRELYNAAVSNFNTSLEQIPTGWFAERFGYKPQPFFLLTQHQPAAETQARRATSAKD